MVGKENRCSFAVVCSRFFWRLFFATCSVARAAASRHGGSSLRLSPDSLLRRQRSLRSERAYVVSSQALLRSALCCFRAEASGASFASLRGAGLRLARLKPDCSSTNRSRPEHLFPPPFRVAASCLFQSAAELVRIQNAKFTIMASMSRRLWSLSDREDLAPGPARAESATPAAGPGEHTKNEYCRLIDSSASPQNDELLLNCAL